MHLKFKETDIVSFIKDLYYTYDDLAKQKEITFNYTPDIEKLNVWIDPSYFDKIVLNLLSNAFKFTPQGGNIQIMLTHTSKFFELSVTDTGVGLEEEEKSRIFDRFYQIQNSKNNSNVGTGIGLHLTRSLVELHHGEIVAENNKGRKGCCFTIRIPMGKDHLNEEDIIETEKDEDIIQPNYKIEKDSLLIAEETSDKVHAKSKYRILLVEDNDDIRHYLYKELGNDFHIQECRNGKEALLIIQQKAPDLVISDVMMPEMDGMTLCKKIKQNVNINHVPVILLTGKTREEDKMEGLQQGADAYITKPFNIEILRQTTINLIKGRELLKNNFSGNQIQEEKIKKIEAESPDERLLKRVMKVINDNMSNSNLNVEMIAKEVGISRVHLHRKLKELTNQSTRDFIRNVRLKQAASLLADKKHSVAEVATLTGFPNVAYFSTAFKDLFGLSPSGYMNQHLESPKEES